MKRIALVLIFAISLTPAINAAGAVKPGSSCAKLGSTSITAGKKFTCVKSGKKLVWDKGRVVLVAKPTPTPSPTTDTTTEVTKPAELKSGDYCNTADQGASKQTSTGNLVCKKDTDGKFHWLLNGELTQKVTDATPPTEQIKDFPAIENGECGKMGIQKSDSKGLLECRKIAGNKLSYIRITNQFSDLANPPSPDNLATCQLSDQRTTKLWPVPGIAYPPTPIGNFKPTGTFKVLVVGIDFPDAKGSGKPSEYWSSDIKNSLEWISWYSNNKVKYEFQTVDKWLEAPRNATAYDNDNEASKSAGNNTLSKGGVTDAEKTAEFLKLIENETDISGLTAIWVYHPPTVVGKLMGQWYNRATDYQSPKYGKINTSIFAIGGDTWESMRVRWGYLLHEMLHSHGIFGHSPKVPWRIGILSTGDSWSMALLGWDSLATGWTNPENLYCVDKSKVTSTQIKLVPLEREQNGVRTAMIKLNNHQLLMVESHRKDKWSFGLAPGFTGVMVTLIDTTKNTTWDNPEGFANPSAVGVALKVDGANHGGYESIGTAIPNASSDYLGIGVVNGIGISGDKESWDLNYFMYQGETITYDGIKISLISTGDNDTIEIAKAS